ncbi:U5 small nuclear ribonucleoprotein TSSC4 [Chironomus tepperi]|uniref:U5 small nuclear ribonucleoprotein TSSC4 n=1 Tax=Chironomus tepperi TaxID=113505 RepID=UPI00391EF297
MEYENKKKALFDILDAEEKKLEGSCLLQRNEENSRKRQFNTKRDRDESIERYKKKESIFKRPALPINKCLSVRQRPDYEKNPQRYQHYTLSDVSDTSDRMNASAAFSFLREMEQRKQQEDENNDSGTSKIVFKNSTKLKPKEVDTDKKEKIQGNKFVMKEYVVGEKKQKQKKEVPRDKNSGSAKQLRLSHLNDEEEDDE